MKRITMEDETYSNLLLLADKLECKGDEKEKLNKLLSTEINKQILTLTKDIELLKEKSYIKLEETDEKRLLKLITLEVLNSDKSKAVSELLTFYAQNNKDVIAEALEKI